ncbi:phage tail tape measure protein [Paenibacillus wenxiniae]|uniref:Phage tail tape measure protein n=1 Tax=Paenibacillus wenxiniae TaxID=1636843 RepID=A0ABW4RH31_9BACL
MADNIKGITVTLGADTTALSSALADVNKKSKSLQTELKDIERLLKFDPGNVDLLAQKQRVLQQSIEQTSSKLTQLRSVQQQVNQQFQNGTISESQFRAFNREITRTEQQLNGLRQQVQSLGSQQINVVINGNATSVSQALGDVSTKGKRLQGELREINRLLELDPNNITLVAQRQQVLSEAVYNTTDKLNRLRSMQEQVNEQYRRGDIGAEQHRQFQREIERTEQELRDLTRQLNNQEEEVSQLGRQYRRAFDEARQSMDNMFDNLKRVGAVAAGAGIAIAAGLGIAASKAADFEQAMSNVKSVMAPDEVKEFGSALQDLALKMGAETKYSATEAAQGIEELVKAGVSTADILNGGLSGALSLATAGELELADAAEIASTALNAFRDDNLTVQQAADLLAGAANASATSVSEMKYSLSAVAAVAAGMGLSFKDTTTAIAVFAQNGLKGSDAGTSLKTMLMNLQPSTKAQIKEFERLGLMTYDVQKGMQVLKDNGIKPAGTSFEIVDGQLQKLGATLSGTKEGSAKARDAYQELTMQTGIAQSAFYDASGSMRGMNEIAGILQKSMAKMTDAQRASSLEILFGSDAIRAGNILFREGAKGVDAMAAAMSKVGADQVAAEKLNNLKGQIEQLNGAVETFMISIGNALLPAIKNMVGGLQSLVDGFNALSPGMQSFIAKAAVITAAIGLFGGGLLVIIGYIPMITAGFTALISLFTTIGPAIGAAFTAATGPIGIAIAAIVAAAALIILNWEPIKEYFLKLWPQIVEATTSAWNGIVEFFSGIWEKIKSFFSSGTGEVVALSNPMIGLPLLIFNHWDELVAMLQTVWTAIKSGVSTAWTAIVTTVTGIVQPFIPLVVNFFNNLKEGISKIWDGLKTYFTGVWEVIKNIFLGALLIIVDLVTGDFEGLKKDTEKIWSNIKDGFSKIWTGIQQVFSGALQIVTSYVSNAWQALKIATTAAFTAIGSAIKSGWNASIAFFSSLPSTLAAWGTKIWTAFKNANVRMFVVLATAISTGLNSAMKFVRELPAKMVQWGKDAIQGLINGMKQMIANVGKVVGDVAETIKTKIRSALDIHSPSRVTRGYGQNVGEGLALGIKDKEKQVAAASASVGKTVDDSFAKSMKRINDNAAAAAAGSKKSADKIKKSFNEAFATAQSEHKLGRLDTDDYIKALQQVQSKYAQTSDQSRKVTLEIAKQHKDLAKEQTEAAKAAYEASKSFIEKRTEDGTFSLTQELAAWQKVQEQYKKGTEQRRSAEEEAGKVRVEIYKKLSEASDNFLAKTKEVNDKVAAEEERLNKAYEDAVTQRASAINDFAGLFDAVSNKSEQTGQELLDNLRSQVQYLGTWSQEIAKLATRGIDQGLLAELREMGPKALPQLIALNQLTDQQLTEYSSLFLQKSAEARAQAVTELTGMKDETTAQVAQLHKEAAAEMNGLKNDFLESVKSISNSSKGEFNAMNKSLTQIGKQSMQGLIAGLKSMKGEVVAQAQDIANAVSKTMQKALDIHSPSRETKWVGQMAGQGLVDGMAAMVTNVKSQASTLATAAMPLLGQGNAAVETVSASSASVNVNAEGMFAGATFSVRSDDDIITLARQIAVELLNQSNTAARGRGLSG